MLGPFFHHFCFQKCVRIRIGDFMKMSFSSTRGPHFQRLRPPRSIQKSMKKRSKNRTLFWTVFGWFGEPFCIHFGIKIASKNRSKNQCDFGSIFGRFWAILGSMWGPLRALGCHCDAPKTIQDAPKTLPRCSQDAHGRQ